MQAMWYAGFSFSLKKKKSLTIVYSYIPQLNINNILIKALYMPKYNYMILKVYFYYVD